mmetsp:Transcript_38243/g.75298  ORF Transcript_38243/g.75298 Transcript_38243/m.75298 type:complete len:223 (-) Transcript_38243:4-672(-)
MSSIATGSRIRWCPVNSLLAGADTQLKCFKKVVGVADRLASFLSKSVLQAQSTLTTTPANPASQAFFRKLMHSNASLALKDGLPINREQPCVPTVLSMNTNLLLGTSAVSDAGKDILLKIWGRPSACDVHQDFTHMGLPVSRALMVQCVRWVLQQQLQTSGCWKHRKSLLTYDAPWKCASRVAALRIVMVCCAVNVILGFILLARSVRLANGLACGCCFCWP